MIYNGKMSISYLKDAIHAAEGYNAQQAHEYYLRTRKLKGRKKTSAPTTNKPAINWFPSTPKPPAPATKPEVKKIVKPAVKKPDLPKDIKKRVDDMKIRITKLRKLLSDLLKEAKIRSGVDEEPEKTKKNSNEKLTAEEKKKAAKASAEYRKENEDKLDLSEQEKNLAKKIKDIEDKIENAKADLKASVDKARKSTTVVKNRQNN